MPWTTGNPCLHYQISGAGRPVVLLHEIGGSIFSWEAAAALLAADFRVVRYDQRGVGLSERPATPFGLADQIADLGEVVAAAGIEGPFALATTAAAATIAAGYALAYPERVAALVFCAPALGLDAEQREPTRARAEATAQAGMRSIIDVAMARMYPVALRAADFDAYRARFLAHDPVGYARATLAFANAEIAVERLEQPCLFLAGDQDIRPVAAVDQARHGFAISDMIVIEGAGHVLPHQAPARAAAAIRSYLCRLREFAPGPPPA